MKRILCFFLGHVPKIHLVRVYTFRYEDGNYVKSRKNPFPVISASCWCSRCGKFMARSTTITD